MQHKRRISLLLALALACQLCVFGAQAAGQSYTMTVQANGSARAQVDIGAEVTVTMTLKCDGEDTFDLYSMQDYVCFDPNYLAYVDGSLTIASEYVNAAALRFNEGAGGRYDRVFMNRASLSSSEFTSGTELVSFKLKTLGAGVTNVTHAIPEIFERSMEPFEVKTVDAVVSIGTPAEQAAAAAAAGGGAGKKEDEKPDEPPVTAASFTDVAQGSYYYDAVAWAVEKGITTGVSATEFRPAAPCNRAQLVTFLWRAMGEPEPGGSNPFSDVPAGSYYEKAVAWAYLNGVTTGAAGGGFAPNGNVTRAQVVAMLYRLAGSPAASGSGFSDVSADKYYASAVAWASQNKITEGTAAGLFSPNMDCNRAQIVTFLYRDLAEKS